MSRARRRFLVAISVVGDPIWSIRHWDVIRREWRIGAWEEAGS